MIIPIHKNGDLLKRLKGGKQMNNKGFTVVELIASFALTMIITVFLFEVLIEVKDIFADTSVKTAILQKTNIISKNIKNNMSDLSNSISCFGSTCTINGKNLVIDTTNNKVTVAGQNFNMPDTVSIKSYVLNNYCMDENCYLYIQMTLESKSLTKAYDYQTTFYYTL